MGVQRICKKVMSGDRAEMSKGDMLFSGHRFGERYIPRLGEQS